MHVLSVHFLKVTGYVSQTLRFVQQLINTDA
jgi:hypothetical protein